MKMEDIGEKQFLADLLPTLSHDPRLIHGIGHDAAALRLFEGDGRVAFLKIDRAAKPIGALRGWTDFRSWGRLAVTANCSDVLATGGTPMAFMLSMILPRAFVVADAQDILRGCAEECKRMGVVFAGGDTKEGQEAQLIGCVLGLGEKARVWGRDTAQVGDQLILSGRLGGFVAAYLALESGDDPALAEAKRYLAYPTARWAEAGFMNRSVDVHASMDLSDGLYDALSTLSKDKGALIEEAALPLHPMAKRLLTRGRFTPLDLSLNVGDWGILYAVGPAEWEAARSKDPELELAKIGVITDTGRFSVERLNGTREPVPKVINEHFAQFGSEEDRYRRMLKSAESFDLDK